MALIALYVLLAFAFAIISLGTWKEEYLIIILGSFFLVSLGLHIFINGIGELTDYTSRYTFGTLIMFTGAYFGARAGIEAFKEGL
jgi:hypothetical protein